MIVIHDDNQLVVESEDSGRASAYIAYDGGDFTISNISRTTGLSMTTEMNREDAVEVAKFLLAHTAKE